MGNNKGKKFRRIWGKTLSSSCAESFRNTGHNITTNFTTVPFAQHLLEKGFTIVGTLKQNKQDISPLLKGSKSRELYSTEFGFSGSLTMVSYVRKKGQVVMLLFCAI